ncbi:response regulator [Acidiphilium iwatense]|uniref:response regulator n=1 Tax=Acidiphilium iwatense TaxID=768198 RepID=UPI002E2FA8F5|nr:response regulator [Acidiphilium iwatense]
MIPALWLLVLVLGTAVIVWGAEAFTEHLGAASVQLGVSAFALALLLAGAEPEELATVVTASLRGSPGIALGDVIGANVTICCVALGVGAWLTPLPFRRGVMRYDLIILDVMLPGQDGWSVLKALRQRRDQTPALFLTARDSVPDRVHGLELGADDYLVKPLAFSELLARIRTILRRGPARQVATVQVTDLEIDVQRHRATRSGWMSAFVRPRPCCNGPSSATGAKSRRRCSSVPGRFSPRLPTVPSATSESTSMKTTTPNWQVFGPAANLSAWAV